jgi:hypothetical protein
VDDSGNAEIEQAMRIQGSRRILLVMLEPAQSL